MYLAILSSNYFLCAICLFSVIPCFNVTDGFIGIHMFDLLMDSMCLNMQQLLLKSIPSCFELKCRAYSLLSQCYHLVGAIPPQKQILNKGLELAASSGQGYTSYFILLSVSLYFVGSVWPDVTLAWTGYSIITRSYKISMFVISSCSFMQMLTCSWNSPAIPYLGSNTFIVPTGTWQAIS